MAGRWGASRPAAPWPEGRMQGARAGGQTPWVQSRPSWASWRGSQRLRSPGRACPALCTNRSHIQGESSPARPLPLPRLSAPEPMAWRRGRAGLRAAMGCACASLSSVWLALQRITNMRASVPAIFPGPGAGWRGEETRGLWLPSPRGAPGQPLPHLPFFLSPRTGTRSPAYSSSPHTPPSSVEGPREVFLLSPGPLVLGSVGALSLGAPAPSDPTDPRAAPGLSLGT